MNIFVLDRDPVQCSRYHLDKHVVKMILETTQLLNNAAYSWRPNEYRLIYPITHLNHPASVWTRTSQENFDWLVSLGIALSAEYTHRYGKIHKCEPMIRGLAKEREHAPSKDMTPFVQCMPDIYKAADPVEAYRNYYRGAKRHIAKWTKREVPAWWDKQP